MRELTFKSYLMRQMGELSGIKSSSLCLTAKLTLILLNVLLLKIHLILRKQLKNRMHLMLKKTLSLQQKKYQKKSV